MMRDSISQDFKTPSDLVQIMMTQYGKGLAYSLVASMMLVNCTSNPALPSSKIAQWHTLELDFEGPQTIETAAENPFLDYRLDVTFTHAETSYQVRGFYAADGEAGDTSAESGNIWRVRFSPDRLGDWQYQARLTSGTNIALAGNKAPASGALLLDRAGAFYVTESEKVAPDFRATGRLIVDGGEYRYQTSGQTWVKGGTNSPENLLGYAGFDDTYRLEAEAREGEADATQNPLHTYTPHIIDWQTGDPVWGKDARGKSIIGAINYLASTGMNAVYFLTLNIDGDGNDVWPFATPDDPSRFDVSKLAQWNRVFAHMQAKGIALHIVVQETENELWLDGGHTGPQRQLYFNELIARFGHHPGLIWNLGEENGPAHWLPEGQTTAQRMAMTRYLEANDPYNHPVVLHTHSSAEDKVALLTPLLGFEALDGLSFQVDEPLRVHEEVKLWRTLSRESGHPWAITMDEIGHWSTGAAMDSDDPDHDSIRRHALWGALMAGASGAEWYFGAHSAANDLTSEDWRLRDNLWRQTRAALDILKTHLNNAPLSSCADGSVTGALYCAETDTGYRVLYVEAGTETLLKTPVGIGNNMSIVWIDPKTAAVNSDANTRTPPSPGRDWVALIH